MSWGGWPWEAMSLEHCPGHSAALWPFCYLEHQFSVHLGLSALISKGGPVTGARALPTVPGAVLGSLVKLRWLGVKAALGLNRFTVGSASASCMYSLIQKKAT